MKKLEEQLSDANRRGDDLQRALTELTVAKNRLTGRVKLEDCKSHGLCATVVGTVWGEPACCPACGLWPSVVFRLYLKVHNVKFA